MAKILKKEEAYNYFNNTKFYVDNKDEKKSIFYLLKVIGFSFYENNCDNYKFFFITSNTLYFSSNIKDWYNNNCKFIEANELLNTKIEVESSKFKVGDYVHVISIKPDLLKTINFFDIHKPSYFKIFEVRKDGTYILNDIDCDNNKQFIVKEDQLELFNPIYKGDNVLTNDGHIGEVIDIMYRYSYILNTDKNMEIQYEYTYSVKVNNNDKETYYYSHNDLINCCHNNTTSDTEFNIGDFVRIKNSNKIFEITDIDAGYGKYKIDGLFCSGNMLIKEEPLYKVGDTIKVKDDICPIKYCKIEEIRVEDHEFRYFINYKGKGLKQSQILEKIKYNPFDKVLVKQLVGGRPISCSWVPQIFQMEDMEGYTCMNGNKYLYAIPYEGNEHLAFTNNDMESC